MTNVDDRSRVVKGLTGAGRFAAEQKQEPDLVLGGDYKLHREAVSQAASDTGIYSGHAYEHRSTALQANSRGEAEAYLYLNDGCDVELCHNYGTGVTTYTCDDLDIRDATDPELIQVAVDDICRSYEGDTAGMFNRLREESLAAPDLDRRVRASLSESTTAAA